MIIGVGIDILEVARIKKVIKRFGSRFLTRVFTDDEIEYCRAKRHAEVHFAARFAAREAFVKALGTGVANGIRWKDIKITNDENGKPGILYSGTTKSIASRIGIMKTHLSLTHGKEYAAAVAILEGR